MERIILIFLLFLTGCAPYRYATCERDPAPRHNEHPRAEMNKAVALHHPLYAVIPRCRCQIQPYDLFHWTTWALFGNEKDGIFGEEIAYHPMELPSFSKALSWYVRNPLHNFNSFVIGDVGRPQNTLILFQFAHCRFTALQHRDSPGEVFPCRSSCFYLALHGWKPFLSFRIAYTPNMSTDFYIGWRRGGSFGLKLNVLKRRKRSDSFPLHSVR